MELKLTSAGSHPRVGDTPEDQRLRRARRLWEEGALSDPQYLDAQRVVTAEAIQEQVTAGLDLVTDGQVRWGDPVSHVAGNFSGVEVNGLLRYFDTNFYFRQPVIRGPVKRKSPLLIEDYRYATSVSERPVKPVLTGPYTTALLSIVEWEGYRDRRKLVEDLARALAEEVAGLSAAGASLIQIDEPEILKHPEDLPLLADALGLLAESKGKAQLALYVYFGDASSLLDRLLDLPVDVLGLDFTYSEDLAERIVSISPQKTLGLGLVDGRNTRLETLGEMRRTLEVVLPSLKADHCYLNPSCGLEYLPRGRAREKLALLSEIRRDLKGGKP